MDYPFENLGPERFQEFCQSLLLYSFKNLQCLPVGMPDGGRDAIQWLRIPGEDAFIVFQIKFVRQPIAPQDVYDWLNSILDKELPKIDRLKRSNIKEYIVLTNARGTSHLDVGGIDKINTLLRTKLDLPTQCWWREDLNRRLDGAWDLKWTYPDLLTGTDFLRLLVYSALGDHQERRSSTVSAFLAEQHRLEQEVKFKQVELQNSLLDLFIDVPISPSGYSMHWRYSGPSNLIRFHQLALHRAHDYIITEDAYLSDYDHLRPKSLGAATFLLGGEGDLKCKCVVLEGAPGQGKSTITQYICQIQRMRLLNKPELAQVDVAHKSGPLRLPIKVDLRDYATWLERKNPFSADAETIPHARWSKNLESFLAALMTFQSGGASFDVSDLHAILRNSAALLVLDGLDEVADIKRREEVVAEIEGGVTRLEATSASLRVIVTSRPTAFENSPGLSVKKFEYYTLDAVTPALIDEYAAKWLKARHLQERESNEVKKILKEKLQQSHIRDLARNPMQLAILLSLIHTRGRSLPDKRTALYDSYIDLFFNRESEKSVIVRDHRDLLINIHQYLAWLLHTESEVAPDRRAGRTNGAIGRERLKQILRQYLNNEGHNPELAESLFSGVVERVVALVSRVEGTYEFEVQPLREYFAARFLFETAPYSPPGHEQRGTRPDRFDAIARNFYWLNVTRFYAGCYSKGELASLIDRLRELVEDSNYRRLGHPRILAATLLGDYVFSQLPRSIAEVVAIIMDQIGLRFILTSSSRRLPRSQPLLLPKDCGRAELVARCFALMSTLPPIDLMLDIIDILKANCVVEELLLLWLERTQRASSIDLLRWFEIGHHLGCLALVDAAEASSWLGTIPDTRHFVIELLKSRRFDVLDSMDALFNEALTAIIDREINAVNRPQYPLEVLIALLNPAQYTLAFVSPEGTSLSQLWKSARGRQHGTFSLDTKVSASKYPHGFQSLLVAVSAEALKEARVWKRSLSPWEAIVGKIAELFGECWASKVLAATSAGIRASSETCTESNALFDPLHNLCRRARYARLRAGNPSWWLTQIEDINCEEDAMFISMLAVAWTSSSTIVAIAGRLNAVVEGLSEAAWRRVFDGVETVIEATSGSPGERSIALSPDMFQSALCTRMWALTGLRVRFHCAIRVYKECLRTKNIADLKVLKFCHEIVVRLIGQDEIGDEDIAVLKRAFQNGVISEPYLAGDISRLERGKGINLQAAQRICENADQFPTFLVAMAEGVCKKDVSKQIRPVSTIAGSETWFGESTSE